MMSDNETTVTNEDAIKFLEGACRNWTKVPRLSNDDLHDVATELDRFLVSRRALPQKVEDLPSTGTHLVGWIYEDELPSSYPYDSMFPHSKVEGVRMFPVFAPVFAPSLQEQDPGMIRDTSRLGDGEIGAE
jgi:hypothetical protein